MRALAPAVDVAARHTDGLLRPERGEEKIGNLKMEGEKEREKR